MRNRAQNKIESHQILLSNALGNEAKGNAENEQDRERIAMDCSRATNTRVNLNRKSNFICQEK